MALIVVAVLVSLWLIWAGVMACLDTRRAKSLNVTMANRALYNRANRILARERQLKADAEWRSRGTWN